MPWDPAQYERFQRERELPFVDALTLVGPLRAGARIVDLGCGTGALTRRLADAYPDAQVLGIDTSPQMLAEAKPRERAGLRFVRGAIEAVDQIGPSSAGPGQIGPDLLGEVGDDPRWDLVFSHASLHWVPDHERLIPRLFARVAPGGRLVAQLPSNHDSDAHRVLLAVAAEPPFAAALTAPVADRAPLPARRYAELLWQAGGRDLVAYEKVYPHELPDADAAVEWMKGTALVPYFDRLPRPLHAAFETRLREAMRAALPSRPLFFGFKRTLFAAMRAA